MLTKDDLQHLVDRIAPTIARDSRPCAAVRVGAIGHRNIEKDVHAQIVGTVKEILRLIRRAAEDALQKKATIRDQFSGGLDLIVISPLAEGADRLIARVGLDQNFRLGAILPFNARDYEATFDLGDSAAAIAEFRKLLDAAALPNGHGILVLDGNKMEGGPRDAAFMRCANTIIRWSDILIAVLSEEGWSSQTGQSVLRAVDMGVPVILVDPKRPKDFSLRINAQGSSPSFLNDERELRECVESLLAPSARPVSAPGEAVSPGSSYDLASYCGERIEWDASRKCEFEYDGPYRALTIAPFWARCCSGLNRWIEKRIAGFLTASVDEERAGPFLWDLPLERITAAPIVELYLRQHRADVIADAYAELQRSVQIVVAFLGVATVTFAALGTQTVSYPAIFAGLEFVCLSLGLAYVWISQRQAWLDRWLDCRLLAEVFRYSKFLLLAGLASPFADLREPYAPGDGERTWARDHAQNVLRANRLSVPGRGQATDVNAVGSIAGYIATQCIGGQSRYHRRTGHLRLKIGEALKTLGWVASFVTFVVVGAKFGLEVLLAGGRISDGPTLEIWRTAGEVAAIVLPALTAGLLALRAFGEHDVVGLRSLAMMKVLEKEKQIVKNAPDMQALGDEMLSVARLLLNDVDGWRELFSGKNLES